MCVLVLLEDGLTGKDDKGGVEPLGWDDIQEVLDEREVWLTLHDSWLGSLDTDDVLLVKRHGRFYWVCISPPSKPQGFSSKDELAALLDKHY